MPTPKQEGFKMPAEWQPHACCWMAWPSHQKTWGKIGLERAKKAYAKVAHAIAAFEPLTMLVNPGEEKEAAMMLGSDIQLMSLVMNDSWTRDTACTFLLNEKSQLGGIDWIHNAWGGNYEDCAFDDQIANAIILETRAKPFKAALVMEGGAFHVDGEGTILTSRECLLNPNRNPSLSEEEIGSYLKEYLNAEKIIWLNQGLIGDETDGHVDEIACFIAPGKVLCLITEDKNDDNYDILQENLKILQNASDAKGRKLEIFTIEQPPATYLQGERLTLSYINFYLANHGIVMPAFNHPKHDKAAFDLMQELFPNYQIRQIEALDVFAGGGGIHCITQQQPRSEYL